MLNDDIIRNVEPLQLRRGRVVNADAAAGGKPLVIDDDDEIRP